MTKNAPMNTLLPQPGQTNAYKDKFHPLPGPYAQQQLLDQGSTLSSPEKSHGAKNDLQRALAAERSQHEHWEQWQGVTPGRPVYANPRNSLNDTLQPNAKYGTEGPGYG